MKIVPLSREIYINFEGTAPPVTIRGLALVDGDLVLAMLAIGKFSGENFIICGIKENVSLKQLIIGWRKFRDQFMKSNETYYALMDDQIKTAPSFLKHFGFVHLKQDIYIFRG